MQMGILQLGDSSADGNTTSDYINSLKLHTVDQPVWLQIRIHYVNLCIITSTEICQLVVET